jgi:hypothetical protein
MVRVIKEQRHHINRAAVRAAYKDVIGAPYLEFPEIKTILRAQILIPHAAFWHGTKLTSL